MCDETGAKILLLGEAEMHILDIVLGYNKSNLHFAVQTESWHGENYKILLGMMNSI
jgi:hypothetical protein